MQRCWLYVKQVCAWIAVTVAQYGPQATSLIVHYNLPQRVCVPHEHTIRQPIQKRHVMSGLKEYLSVPVEGVGLRHKALVLHAIFHMPNPMQASAAMTPA